MSVSTDLLSQAVAVSTGRGASPYPLCDDQRVVDSFGGNRALDLVPRIHVLVAEFNESDAVATAPTMAAVWAQPAAHFRKRHPELSEDAVDALAWCYAHENK